MNRYLVSFMWCFLKVTMVEKYRRKQSRMSTKFLVTLFTTEPRQDRQAPTTAQIKF